MANVPLVSWSETTPAGSESRSLGDNRIREMKSQLREIIAVDHEMDSSGQDTDWGRHKKITFNEQADLGTGVDGVPLLGAQTIDGKAELVFTDEDDNDVQLTSGGKIGSTSTDILANSIEASAGIIASGAVAIGSTLNVIGATTLSSLANFPTTPSEAPDADYEVVNKKYVDDNAITTTKIGTFSTTSTGALSVTGIGFQPSAIILIVGDAARADAKSGSTIAMFDGSSGMAFNSEWNDGDRSGTSFATNSMAAYRNNNAYFVASFTSLDSDGFTINISTAASDGAGFYLAIK